MDRGDSGGALCVEERGDSSGAGATETVTRVVREYDYCRMLNSRLPPAIRAVAWSPVTEDFSARFSCTARMYRYFFIRRGLDLGRMRDALARKRCADLVLALALAAHHLAHPATRSSAWAMLVPARTTGRPGLRWQLQSGLPHTERRRRRSLKEEWPHRRRLRRGAMRLKIKRMPVLPLGPAKRLLIRRS